MKVEKDGLEGNVNMGANDNAQTFVFNGYNLIWWNI